MLLRSLTALAILTASVSLSAQEAWIGTWGASPLAPSPAAGPFPATPSFENQTVRQFVRVSAGGTKVRLRLTNEYGTVPLEVGAALVAIADGEALRAGTERVVTFAGQPSAVIPAGAPLLSDPIDLAVADLESLSISLYFPSATGACTCHSTGMQNTYVSAAGNFTTGTFTAAQTIQARAFLSGIEVLREGAGVIVVLGDSISDGIGSTVGANRRWPDLLAERLAGRVAFASKAVFRRAPTAFGVVNHGISGNRVLGDGAGESALARFDRDVLSVPGLTHVIVFEGVNDLGFAYGRFEGPMAAVRNLMAQGMAATEENMVAGYRQLIARAHAKGLKIYGATIAPYQGAMYFSAEGEAVRQAINTWIRESGEFDAVLDFDAVLRDPAEPAKMKDGLHSGDFLHGSDAGYKAVADSIDLGLF